MTPASSQCLYSVLGGREIEALQLFFYRHPHPGVHTKSVDNDAEKESELEDMLRGYYEDSVRKYVLYIRFLRY